MTEGHLNGATGPPIGFQVNLKQLSGDGTTQFI